MLTDAERKAARLAGELFTFIRDNVCGNGPTRDADLAELAADIAELTAVIHRIQHRVMAQAAARLYPGEFRLMGEVTGGSETGPPRKPPAVTLLEEALFLRVNGERPPGHDAATWRDWDLEAERFLRSLLPPEPEGEEP